METLTPGWIYVANVLTYNGYEGVKIGGTEGTRGTPQKRIDEHLRSVSLNGLNLLTSILLQMFGTVKPKLKGG